MPPKLLTESEPRRDDEELPFDDNSEPCTCHERGCIRTLCKGDCGCEKCHDAYQDFLSTDRD